MINFEVILYLGGDHYVKKDTYFNNPWNFSSFPEQ